MEKYVDFLIKWEQIMFVLFIITLTIAIIILMVYYLKYKATKDLKDKYDLASASESRILLSSQYVIALSVFFIINTLQTETVQQHLIWLFIRIFIGFSIAFLHGYVAYLLFNYYYPGPLQKRLERLRYTPRINSKTGNKMQLLSEDEEDAFLDEGMQAEENVFSVDYDVWIDPKTKEVKIEKYKGHLTAHECDRCGFQTLRLVKEEILSEATEFYDGEIQKEFKCSYCNRIKRKTVKLSKKVKNDFTGAKMIDNPLEYDKRIGGIKIEIFNQKGNAKVFDFQTISQAKNFLEEFDFEKLEE